MRGSDKNKLVHVKRAQIHLLSVIGRPSVAFDLTSFEAVVRESDDNLRGNRELTCGL